jgi:hypothetical protein
VVLGGRVVVDTRFDLMEGVTALPSDHAFVAPITG